MTTVGTIELLATIDTSKYKKGADDIDRQNKKIEDSTEDTSSKMNKSLNKVAKIGFGAILAATTIVAAAITANIGGAIKRVDTLNNSTRTFENMGFVANDITKSMKDLEKSIQGLPTSLDEAVSGVQLLAGATGDISQARKIFTAINNGVIGFGGNAEQVSGAVRQLSQDLAGGTITAETWNSLLDNGLGPTLNAIAKQMGITSKELKAGLSEGTVSTEEFTAKLIEMNEKGGGGMKSLETIAKDATSGIGTSFANLQTAIVRSIGNILKVIGVNEISGSINGISQSIDNFGKTVASVTEQYIKPFFLELNKAFGEVFKNQQVIEGLRIIVISLGVAIGIIVAGLALAAIGIVAIVAGIAYVVGFISDLLSDFAFGVYRVGKFISDVFVEAYKNIISTFGPLILFFFNLRNSILGVFSNIGTAIGNAVGGAFRAVMNGILSYVGGIVNGIIDSINGIVGAIDRVIPGDQSGFKMRRLGIPRLADGGIVSSATLAMVGEGSEPEAVIPLSKLDEMMNGNANSSENVVINLQMDGVMTRSRSDQREIAMDMIESINEVLRARQLPQIGNGHLRRGTV